jgi:hypothetical protein
LRVERLVRVWVKTTVKMVCARELAEFICVDATAGSGADEKQ